MTQFIERIDGINYFNFKCESCKAEGRLGVRAAQQRVACPEGCGTEYIQWDSPPKLKCVVMPVFKEET